MLQVNIIKEEKKRVLQGLDKRNFNQAPELLDKVISLDQTRRETQLKHDAVLSDANALSKQVGNLMKVGQKDEVEKIKQSSATLKKESAALSTKLNEVEGELKKMLYLIPNVPHESVPKGIGADQNITVHEWGKWPVLGADAKPHWELITQYDVIDFELGNKISGAGFPVYKGKGARLQRALINFFLENAIEQGYYEIQPPIVVNEASGYGTGQLPDKEGQMYYMEADNLYMIPTAEVPITNLYRGVIVSDEQLPIKNVGYTPCFRREAGSWGAHVRGLNRLHQFDKVEIVQICKPANSYRTLEEMCLYVQSLLEKLGLPYRKLLLCGGDLGFNAALTFDMEVYAGAQKRWLEVSSVSNFETFQANRLKLRYKHSKGKTQLLHTLNGSALALPRIMAAILENNQTKEGIEIPKVLWDYTGFKKID